jgi:hypothetical protein
MDHDIENYWSVSDDKHIMMLLIKTLTSVLNDWKYTITSIL